jgi:hypothetical protein
MKKLSLLIIVTIALAVTSCGSLRKMQTTSRAPNIALERINIGAYNNDPSADKARTAFDKADKGIAELNRLQTYYLEPTELAILRGATVTTAELNRIAGVTSAVQTQINGRIRAVDSTLTSAGNYVTRKALVDSIANSGYATPEDVIDSIDQYIADGEVGVVLTQWNNGIEDNYIKALQAAGMSIKAGPSFGLYPRVSHSLYDAQAIYTQFYFFDTLEVTGVGFIQDTQGAYTADNYNGFAIYSVSGTTYTYIDSTANDGDIWKTTANTSATRAFATGPHTLNPGLYYVFLVYNSSAQTTAPKIYFNNDFLHAAFSALTGTNKIAGIVTAQITPPATETGVDVTASNEIPVIWLY